MSFEFSTVIFFALLSLGASTVNGGLGYGYSSISTPLALLVVINRILNPAYALLEAFLNTVMLVSTGRKNFRTTLRRTTPVIVTILPGVVLGSLALSAVAPTWVRLLVYVLLLPLILLQAAGYRRPIKNEAAAGAPLGLGVGFLYSLTTISGPPLALFWNNQGLGKQEFKASLSLIRIVEAYSTCTAYYFLGLFTPDSFSLFGIIAPPVVVGIPLGMLLVRRVHAETFRRICTSFDAWIVGYGLTRVLMLRDFLMLGEVEADSLFVLIFAIDGVLLYRFFYGRTRRASPAPSGIADPPQEESREEGG